MAGTAVGGVIVVDKVSQKFEDKFLTKGMNRLTRGSHFMGILRGFIAVGDLGDRQINLVVDPVTQDSAAVIASSDPASDVALMYREPALVALDLSGDVSASDIFILAIQGDYSTVADTTFEFRLYTQAEYDGGALVTDGAIVICRFEVPGATPAAIPAANIDTLLRDDLSKWSSSQDVAELVRFSPSPYNAGAVAAGSTGLSEMTASFTTQEVGDGAGGSALYTTTATPSNIYLTFGDYFTCVGGEELRLVAWYRILTAITGTLSFRLAFLDSAGAFLSNITRTIASGVLATNLLFEESFRVPTNARLGTVSLQGLAMGNAEAFYLGGVRLTGAVVPSSNPKFKGDEERAAGLVRRLRELQLLDPTSTTSPYRMHVDTGEVRVAAPIAAASGTMRVGSSSQPISQIVEGDLTAKTSVILEGSAISGSTGLIESAKAGRVALWHNVNGVNHMGVYMTHPTAGPEIELVSGAYWDGSQWILSSDTAHRFRVGPEHTQIESFSGTALDTFAEGAWVKSFQLPYTNEAVERSTSARGDDPVLLYQVGDFDGTTTPGGVATKRLIEIMADTGSALGRSRLDVSPLWWYLSLNADWNLETGAWIKDVNGRASRLRFENTFGLVYEVNTSAAAGGSISGSNWEVAFQITSAGDLVLGDVDIDGVVNIRPSSDAGDAELRINIREDGFALLDEGMVLRARAKVRYNNGIPPTLVNNEFIVAIADVASEAVELTTTPGLDISDMTINATPWTTVGSGDVLHTVVQQTADNKILVFLYSGVSTTPLDPSSSAVTHGFHLMVYGRM